MRSHAMKSATVRKWMKLSAAEQNLKNRKKFSTEIHKQKIQRPFWRKTGQLHARVIAFLYVKLHENIDKLFKKV